MTEPTTPSAVDETALPETAGVNAGPSTLFPPSDLPNGPSGQAAGGERVAARSDGTYLDEIADDVQRLMRSSESVGYERGYLACLNEIVEHVTSGLKVDSVFLSGMLYRPLLCRFCRNPLNRVERDADDTCSECAKHYGEDAR